MSNDAAPHARLRGAQLALKVDAQRIALDEDKGRLLDTARLSRAAVANSLTATLKRFLDAADARCEA